MTVTIVGTLADRTQPGNTQLLFGKAGAFVVEEQYFHRESLSEKE